MGTMTQEASENEVTILARVLGNDRGELSEEMARQILNLGFSDREEARMHDLALRNQADALTSDEQAELLAYGKAGDLLAILKSKARKTLGIKLIAPSTI